MLASLSGLPPANWNPDRFYGPSRTPKARNNGGRAAVLNETAKPRPRRVPASLYRDTQLGGGAMTARADAPNHIEGSSVSLNNILDKLTTQMNCSYILQPGIKTNIAVRLEVGEPDELMANLLKMVGLSFKVNGRLLYIGREEWLEQVFPSSEASLVITEPTPKKMDDTVDAAQKISDGKLEVKRVGKYSVVTGTPEHLQNLLKSDVIPAESHVQALYASHVPADGLIKQVPSSILAGNVMESFEDRSVRIQGSPTHVAAALNLLVNYDREQTVNPSQLAMLRDRTPKAEEKDTPAEAASPAEKAPEAPAVEAK